MPIHYGMCCQSQYESIVLLQVSLYRSDALATVLELDHNLMITHADNTAGLIFGLDARQLHKKSLAG